MAVAFINPYGVRGFLFPLSLVTRFQEENVFKESIGEFVSPFALKLSDQFPFYPKLPIDAFRVLAVLALVSLPILFKRRRWDLCLVLLAFFALAAAMVRNMPLLVIAGLPPLVWAFPAAELLQRAGIAPAKKRKILGASLALLCPVLLFLSDFASFPGTGPALRAPAFALSR